MKLFRKGQGATEYLLMLAAVLVIVAIAVYYVTSAGPSAIITGTATLCPDNNDVVFTPATTMSPDTITAANWEYTIYRDATPVYPASGWASGVGTLERGIPIVLNASDSAATGDIVKIKSGGTVFDAATVQP